MRRGQFTSESNATRDGRPFARKCVACEVREGVPTTKSWGYYTSRNGSRILVVECRPGQRIRINGAVEIVVLGADNETARFGIDGEADPNGDWGG
jgi:hypothetical protein